MAYTAQLVNSSNKSNLNLVTLQAMLDEAAALIKYAAANPNETYMKTWFGARNIPTSRAAVDTGMGQVLAWLKAHKTIKFTQKSTAGLAHTDKSKDDNEIFLDAGFRMKRYSWGEKVCTIIHEITHKSALQTVDFNNSSGAAVFDVGGSFYGVRCLDLAGHNTKFAKALVNADNWAYYICAYRTNSAIPTKNDREKWKYFSKNQLEARGPFPPSEAEKAQLDDDTDLCT